MLFTSFFAENRIRKENSAAGNPLDFVKNRRKQEEAKKEEKERSPGGMEIFNNTTKVVGDDLKKTIKPGCRVSIAAACFSIYAYQELKA